MVIIQCTMNQKNLNNILGQRIGEIVDNWNICEAPPKSKMEGKKCVY